MYKLSFKKLLVLIVFSLLTLTACGGGGGGGGSSSTGDSQPDSRITGMWSGLLGSSDIGSRYVTFNLLEDVNNDVSGNFVLVEDAGLVRAVPSQMEGYVSGTRNGDIVVLTLTNFSGSCAFTFTVTGQVTGSGTTGDFFIDGTDCDGQSMTGAGTVQYITGYIPYDPNPYGDDDTGDNGSDDNNGDSGDSDTDDDSDNNGDDTGNNDGGDSPTNPTIVIDHGELNGSTVTISKAWNSELVYTGILTEGMFTLDVDLDDWEYYLIEVEGGTNDNPSQSEYGGTSFRPNLSSKLMAIYKGSEIEANDISVQPFSTLAVLMMRLSTLDFNSIQAFYTKIAEMTGLNDKSYYTTFNEITANSEIWSDYRDLYGSYDFLMDTVEEYASPAGIIEAKSSFYKKYDEVDFVTGSVTSRPYHHDIYNGSYVLIEDPAKNTMNGVFSGISISTRSGSDSINLDTYAYDVSLLDEDRVLVVGVKDLSDVSTSKVFLLQWDETNSEFVIEDQFAIGVPVYRVDVIRRDSAKKIVLTTEQGIQTWNSETYALIDSESFSTTIQAEDADNMIHNIGGINIFVDDIFIAIGAGNNEVQQYTEDTYITNLKIHNGDSSDFTYTDNYVVLDNKLIGEDTDLNLSNYGVIATTYDHVYLRVSDSEVWKMNREFINY